MIAVCLLFCVPPVNYSYGESSAFHCRPRAAKFYPLVWLLYTAHLSFIQGRFFIVRIPDLLWHRISVFFGVIIVPFSRLTRQVMCTKDYSNPDHYGRIYIFSQRNIKIPKGMLTSIRIIVYTEPRTFKGMLTSIRIIVYTEPRTYCMDCSHIF